jgi:hypothetical protein
MVEIGGEEGEVGGGGGIRMRACHLGDAGFIVFR